MTEADRPDTSRRRMSSLDHACRPTPPLVAAATVPRPALAGSLRRALFLGAGCAFVVLATIGVVVPVLPTTPFLLLAAACFFRSSERMHRWLLGNRLFGEYLRRYRDGEGMSVSAKMTTLVLLWATLAASLFWAVPDATSWTRIALIAVGLGVTIFVVRIKTHRA